MTILEVVRPHIALKEYPKRAVTPRSGRSLGLGLGLG